MDPLIIISTAIGCFIAGFLAGGLCFILGRRAKQVHAAERQLSGDDLG